MGHELTTDRYPLITSQTGYPLRHAASSYLSRRLHFIFNGETLLCLNDVLYNKTNKPLLCIRNELVDFQF